jgi:hypothetical protein
VRLTEAIEAAPGETGVGVETLMVVGALTGSVTVTVTALEAEAAKLVVPA